MNEIFRKVAEALTDKKLQKKAISLSSKLKPTVAKELERTRRFATELYFKNYENEVLTIIEVLEADKLFIKPTNSGQEFIGNVIEALPYKGTKLTFLI